jgi:hypothetical protein
MSCCNPTTNSICGPFADPDVTDGGCSWPLGTLRDCEAPVLPTLNCNEAEPDIIFDADTGLFSVWSTLFDQLCSAITDQNNDPILTLML